MNKKSVYRQVKITEIKAEDLLNSQRTPREAETVKSPVSSASKNKDAGKDQLIGPKIFAEKMIEKNL